MENYPDFDSLPAVEGQPQGNTWGFWGKDDELGTLNFLTSNAKLNAAKEIQKGKSVQLDLRLDYFDHGIAGRERFQQKIIDLGERNQGTEYELIAHDDYLAFNTQSSSQWDGLRHVGLQHSGTYYNGMKHRDIDEGGGGRLGIQRWVENGGIVGRGVLLDYERWIKDTGQQLPRVDDRTSYSVKDLEEVAKHQNLELKDGDILIIRSGFTIWYDNAEPAERAKSLDKGAFIGLEASMESVKWLWNHHFAAVAGDTIAFEVHPIPFRSKDDVVLHEWLLTHWGCPIGELWNLEKLAEICAELGKWSFFFTSAPLNVFGGVASTPNAIAVF